MIRGSIRCALQAGEDSGRCREYSPIGGSMGTDLSTAVMREFPYGLPKLMISTIASGFTAPFVGLNDIAMLHAVCDISGINSISREVIPQQRVRPGRPWPCTMHRCRRAPGPWCWPAPWARPERCLRRMREALEKDGYEMMVFHTTGIGGQTLDAIAAEARCRGRWSIFSLVEISDYLNNGVCNAGRRSVPRRRSSAASQ